MISSLTLLLQQNTYKNFKQESLYNEPLLKNPDVEIKITHNNIYVLTYWCLRDINMIDSFLKDDPNFEFNESTNKHFLQQKYDEQIAQGFHHNFVGNDTKIDVKIKNKTFYAFITIVPGK